MSDFSWIEEVEDLSPAMLTVRAQTLSPNDQGRLTWDVFFRRENVDSVDLDDVTTLDDRWTSERREWNAEGAEMPDLVPPRRKVSIVPIEGKKTIGEKEIQKLAEGSFGRQDVIVEQMGIRIPDRAMRLAMGDYRRLEVDSANAWALGTITQRIPEDPSKTYTASFGFDTGRYQTALTAWNDPSVNAYDEFTAWVEEGVEEVGSLAGVRLRQVHINAILEDAPELPNGVRMTKAGLVQRIQDDLGADFQFFKSEETVHIRNDGGSATTPTKVWPSRMALVPAGGFVGQAAFAPVGAGIDVRGVTVYYIQENGGRTLKLNAQLNALAVPDEQLMWVMNPGF
jgi:hypothetical protein